jgi:2-oxo-hept-3-ene-1,7-dioate hydratase
MSTPDNPAPRTFDDAQAARMAERLDEAERTRTQIGQLSAEHPGMTIEDAYAVQTAWVDAKLARGRKVIGHKIGLTSRAMQRAANITEPDHGTLLDDMLLPDGVDLPFDRFIEPRVEVELAFVLNRRLEGQVSLGQVLAAVDYVTPALEIIDARIARVDPNGRTRMVYDTISDNAANAAIILGGRPVKVDAIDLRWVAALLYRNATIEDSGVAAAVLNHPAMGVVWLARKLGSFGVALEPGQIVLSGSFTSPVPIAAGDSFYVDYGPLGAIATRFT